MGVGKCWSKGTKLQLCRMNNYGDLMYNMMTTANNTVLNMGNMLIEVFSSHTEDGNSEEMI